MALSCGIVGLPNVGKSTIFNALTRSAQALAANYPFATIEPTSAKVPVPDDRLTVLAELVNSQRIVNAAMRFVDIAGLVRGASSGAGLGNAFLSHIRETDAVAMVVRAFEDDDVSHVEGRSRPAARHRDHQHRDGARRPRDARKACGKLEREARVNPKLGARLEAAKRLRAALEEGTPARSFAASSLEMELARESFLITAKPLLYVANVDEAQIEALGAARAKRLRARRARG